MIRKELYAYSPDNKYPGHGAINTARNLLKEQMYTSGFAVDQNNVIPGVTYVRLPNSMIATQTNWQDFISSLHGITNFIGMGKDRIVARIPGKENTVMSVFHEPRDWFFLQEVLRVNHILYGLFPHNFPRIYGFYGCNDIYEGVTKPNGFYYTGFWSDYIEGGTSPIKDCLTQGLSGLIWSEDDFRLEYADAKTPQHSFARVVHFMNDIGLSLRHLGFDPHKYNFIRKGEDECYIDVLTGPFQMHSHDYFNIWNSQDTLAKLDDKRARGDVPLTDSQYKFVKKEIQLLGKIE